MARIRKNVPEARIEVGALQEPKGSDFPKWGERFFAYLVREKSGTNAGLVELIYWLGEDGRLELALSVFNFLRPCVWKDFCQDRRIAKGRARKRITKARSDLRRAGTAYGRLLGSMPEIGIYRQLGGDTRLHLSDILEIEAAFLSTQARIARAAGRRVRRVRQEEVSQLEQNVTRQNAVLLSIASAKLARAAKSYRELLTLTQTAAIGKAFDSFPPSHLAAVLESEEADLRGFLGRVDPAFNKKRLGTKTDLGILVRLQYLVELFGLRWMAYLPENATKLLRETDIADLLEAGTNALGTCEPSPLIDAESIGRALERFQQRESNDRTCLLLKQSAQETCNRFRLRPPASKTAQQCRANN